MGWSILKIVIVTAIVIASITAVVLATTLTLLPSSGTTSTTSSTTTVSGSVIQVTPNSCSVLYLTYAKDYYGINTTLVSFDTANNVFTTIGNDMPVPIRQLIISPINNTLYGVANKWPEGFQFYLINQQTAALTLLCETTIRYDLYHGLPRISIDSNGTFWLCGDGPDLLYTLDPTTCLTTIVASATLPFTFGGIVNDTFYHIKTPEYLLYKQTLTPSYGVSLIGTITPVITGLTSRIFAYCPTPGDIRLQMGWQYQPSVVNFTSLNPSTAMSIPGTQFYVPLPRPQDSAWGITSSCWCQ